MDSPVASADERKQQNTAQYLIYTKLYTQSIRASNFPVLIEYLVSMRYRLCFPCINALVLNCPFSSHALLAR